MTETPLEQNVRHHYLNVNHNCAETLLAACNDTFNLNIPTSSLILISGFGGGMFTGNTCGALSGCTAALAAMLVKTKAHETPDLPKAERLLIRNFQSVLGNTQCAQIKLNFYSPEERCLNTCLKAAQAMNQTLLNLQKQGILNIDSTLLQRSKDDFESL